MGPRRGIGGYRGRRTAHEVLVYLAVGLGVLLLLALVGMFLLQDKIVYTDQGVRFPWESSASASLPDPGQVSYTLLPPEGEIAQ